VHYVTHGDSLSKIHNLFGNLKTELELHLIKEERILFPMIKAYELNPNQDLKDEIMKYIATTEDEHDVAGDLFKALDIETDNYQAPADGCITYTRTFQLMDDLEKDTFNHIHLENSILFNMI
jgi:regulator of cell morphogenesis and NO signaling